MTNLFFSSLICLGLLLFSGCDESSDGSSHYNASIVVDGLTRTYIVNIPPAYFNDDTTQFALVIGLHGFGGRASQFERDYGFSKKANAAGFIAVYPDGVQGDGVFKIRGWNAGTCCEYASEHNIDDVNFISKLIDKVAADHRINRRKVYVTGMSNGGMMAYRLACELPDKIAAIAPVSCTMVVKQPCEPDRPMPILHMHSAIDTKVPYNGGTGLAGYYFPPVDSTLNVWSKEDDCKKTVQQENRTNYQFLEWDGCSDNSIIQCYVTADGGHAWPGGSKVSRWADTPSTAINANDLMWDFFQHYELPQ